MAEKKPYTDLRSNVDPVDNKPYVEFIREDEDSKTRIAAKNKKNFNAQLKKDNIEAGFLKDIKGKRITAGYGKGNFKVEVSKGPEGKGAMFSYSKTLGSESKPSLSEFVDNKANGGVVIGKGKDYIKDIL